MQRKQRASKKSTLTVSVEEFIEQEKGTIGWNPPPHMVPELDKFIRHNRENPEFRLGAIKITGWLDRNGVKIGKDVVYRWMKKRSKLVK